MTIAVVTRVCEPLSGGNLSCAMPMYLADLDRVSAIRELGKVPQELGLLLSLRVPVFSLGEIIVLDGSGREIGGEQRKPSKWDVSVEEFDTVGAAVARSREVR